VGRRKKLSGQSTPHAPLVKIEGPLSVAERDARRKGSARLVETGNVPHKGCWDARIRKGKRKYKLVLVAFDGRSQFGKEGEKARALRLGASDTGLTKRQKRGKKAYGKDISPGKRDRLLNENTHGEDTGSPLKIGKENSQKGERPGLRRIFGGGIR